MRKALSVIGNIVIAIIMVFAVVMTTMVIISTKSEVGMPSLFGKTFFYVKTDSMKGENGFDKGSLIIVDLLEGDEYNQLKVGDVVTFWRYYGGEKYLETHRIVEDKYTAYTNQVKDGILVHGGVRYYVTKGDNTPDIDFLSNLSGPDYANDGSIIGVWTGIAVPRLGSVLSFLQAPNGFMICIVIPAALFFFFELYKFISTLMEKKKQNAVAAVADAEDEIKQKAIAEYLAQQEAEKAKQAQAPAEPAAEAAKEPPAEQAPAEPVAEAAKEQPAETADEQKTEQPE